ncbi:EAL domain-containing protein [Elioraea sp.]|jgi:EAL domain-containing protein (putative c-di-GMP-specific phosphodiesterase class I)|uniref:EAL domain-containing protein n=1 Tax=Elioraea sp. TaxID=2185103 RepID=UPI0021DC184F|nr:EAL domain-containing protein [Elioraea sp.]GIX09896.1 MAG: signal transduction protein [Elioraea sp.]
MHCPDCERVKSLLHDRNSVHVVAPTGFTLDKIRAAATAVGLESIQDGDPQVLRLDVARATFPRFAEALEARLSIEERTHARALVLPAAAAATMRDWLGTRPLQAMIGHVKAAWLADLLEQDRLVSALQPILRADGTAYGHEALLRAIGPDGAVIGAGPLMAAARETELLFALDLAARKAALETAARFGPERGVVFVNFDPSSIYDPHYCLKETAGFARALGLSPESIVFEVTEGSRVRSLDHLRGILDVYREAKFRVALDDVGAGFSGLNTLRLLRPDIIKLDMELVRDVATDRYRQAIVRHLIGLAHDLGILVLAEGIETEEERRWLVAAGVDLLQGYLLGRPFLLAAEERPAAAA